MASSRRVFRASSWLVVLLLLPACNSLNPLCRSSRPAPILNSIVPAALVFSALQPSFVMTLTGANFVASTVVVFNGATLPTTVVSSTELTVTITSDMISGPGAYNVEAQTPAGNTGAVGCSSGGTSSTLVLTIS